MLIELAIGDAYGAGFEFVPQDVTERENDLSGYIQHPKHKIPAGSYTDDTQMSMAIAEHIVSGEEWTPLAIANRFVNGFHRDPREGYAQGFYNFLCGVESGEEFLATIKPFSNRNGAAMRAVPIGVYKDITNVCRFAVMQSAITHDTDEGVVGGCVVALMSHYVYHNLGRKKELPYFLNEIFPETWEIPWKERVPVQAIPTVRAAITAFVNNNSLKELLFECVTLGGDVDSVAAIAVGVAALSKEYKKDLPLILHKGLENGEYGYMYINALDDALLSRRF